MMWRVSFAALLSHWRRKPLQLFTLIAGLALATALWSGVQAIDAEARSSYASAESTIVSGSFDQLVRIDGRPIDQGQFVEIRRAGWLVSPVLRRDVDLGGKRFDLIGFDPFTAPRGLAPQSEIEDLDVTGFLLPPGQIFANPSDLAALASLDQEIVTAEEVPEGTLFADISVARTLLGLEDVADALIIAPAQPLGLRSLDDVAPALERKSPSAAGDIARLTDSFHLNLTAFGLLSFAVGLFIVHGAIGLAFEQRRSVFRTLRALGLPLQSLIILISLELTAIALFAGAIGMALGYLIAAALLPDVAATLRGLYGAEVDGTLSLRPGWWVAGMAMAMAGTAVAAAQAVVKVARLPLLASAQPRAWARASEQRLIVLSTASTALFLSAILLGAFGHGLVSGFAMLGALLLGAALALPVLLHGAILVGSKMARGVLASWFWADTRQQLPGLSLALMALLLALAANVGVGTMVASFRLTFTGWLDQRLASELYVVARDQAEARRLTEFLGPRTDAVLPIWDVEARVLGLPAEIYGVADHETYRDHWPMLSAQPNVWDSLAQGQGVLINEQLGLREGLAPGDLLAIPIAGQQEVLGLYSDYGNPTGQILMGLPHFIATFPEAEKRRFGIRVDPAKAESLIAAIKAEVGLPSDNITDQASIKELSLRVFERTFTVTGALNVLTLSVAGFAILTSLLTLATLRQPQLAPVWALGLTRRKLASLELLRALLLAALTTLAAIPIGLLLAWVLLTVINVEAFGWRIPMHLFPLEWLRLAVFAILAAAIAALWPARKLARTPPAELLKVFANER